jgi:hypothetical protein
MCEHVVAWRNHTETAFNLQFIENVLRWWLHFKCKAFSGSSLKARAANRSLHCGEMLASRRRRREPNSSYLDLTFFLSRLNTSRGNACIA